MSVQPNPTSPVPTQHKRKSHTSSNPLQSAISSYLSAHHPQSTIPPSSLPRRYSIYPPLLLLSSNTFTSPPVWSDFFAPLDVSERQDLYACIVRAFEGKGVTHLALNAPIAAETMSGEVNSVRSPTGLVGLCGDFGPRSLLGDGDGAPTGEDFEKAFWCSAEQNGVTQVWAPRWTMFSRGNVKEKARIMGMGGGFAGLDDDEDGDGLAEQTAVVDMFVGIGYFAFCYLRRGFGVVWGWEVNGWSVEGLRRGAERNGWGVMVVRVREGDGFVGEEVLMEGLRGKARVVVFHGDNCWAGKVMGRLEWLARRMSLRWRRVRHVNLGLLPDARGAWNGAVRVLDGEVGGWLHVHENVDVSEIEGRREEMVKGIDELCAKHRGGKWKVGCVHVEQVKTYAPGVMHCVFDIEMKPP